MLIIFCYKSFRKIILRIFCATQICQLWTSSVLTVTVLSIDEIEFLYIMLTLLWTCVLANARHPFPFHACHLWISAFLFQSKWLPLHTLAASGEFYLLDALLKHNVDINAIDKVYYHCNPLAGSFSCLRTKLIM